MIQKSKIVEYIINEYIKSAEKEEMPPLYAFIDIDDKFHVVDDKDIEKIMSINKSKLVPMLKAFKKMLINKNINIKNSIIIQEVFMQKIDIEGKTYEERSEKAEKAMEEYSNKNLSPSEDINSEEALMIILEDEKEVNNSIHSIIYDTKKPNRIIERESMDIFLLKTDEEYKHMMGKNNLIGIFD